MDGKSMRSAFGTLRLMSRWENQIGSRTRTCVLNEEGRMVILGVSGEQVVTEVAAWM